MHSRVQFQFDTGTRRATHVRNVELAGAKRLGRLSCISSQLMWNTAAFAATRPLAHMVFTPPSKFHVCSSMYTCVGGDAGLNPPALYPFATDA